MAQDYKDAFEQLKVAQEDAERLAGLSAPRERQACLSVFFTHLYQAALIAGRCFEVSNHDDAAQGGAYGAAKAELNDFLQAKDSAMALAMAPAAEADEICARWLKRGQAYVRNLQQTEASITNLQYARIPEAQDYSIISKDGKDIRRTL